MKQRRKLRMGMVGGGPGSFIGPVHRMAAELDGEIELVAGAFSQSAARSLEAAESYNIQFDRSYGSFEELFEREMIRPDPIDFVSIVTPNHLHLPVARSAMLAGLHVVSDKPATATLAEALELEEIVRKTQSLYALTFTYTGYAMVHEAREICRSGKLGSIRKVVVEYLQGWLSTPLEETGQKQASWRADPSKAGIGGCIGDIGVHAFNLMEFVTQHRVHRLSADLRSVVPGRVLDDDCTVMMQLENGAPALLFASQIATGERNGLRLRIFGTQGSLSWEQEDPTRLEVRWLDAPDQVFHAGGSLPESSHRAFTRLPAGHPEGLIEAFANIYRDFSLELRSRLDPGITHPEPNLLCGIEDGVRSMAFVERSIASSRNHGSWTELESSGGTLS